MRGLKLSCIILIYTLVNSSIFFSQSDKNNSKYLDFTINNKFEEVVSANFNDKISIK